MEKLQFYKFASILLLILNLGVFGYFIYNRPQGNHRPHQRGATATEKLKLDKFQDEQFHEYANIHIKEVESYSDEQKKLLRLYFSRLAGNTIANPTVTLERVKQLEVQKIVSTYNHLSDVKGILKPEQDQYFDSFMDHVMNSLLPDESTQRPNHLNRKPR